MNNIFAVVFNLRMTDDKRIRCAADMKIPTVLIDNNRLRSFYIGLEVGYTSTCSLPCALQIKKVRWHQVIKGHRAQQHFPEDDATNNNVVSTHENTRLDESKQSLIGTK